MKKTYSFLTKFHYNSSVIFLSFFLLFLISCDKSYEEPIGDSSQIPEDYFTDDYDGDTETAIDELDFLVTVKDGLLEFKSTEDFQKASAAINNSTDEMIKSWSNNLGHQSQFIEYVNILNRFEALEGDVPNFDKEFTSLELAQYQFILDDGAYWVEPKLKSRSISALLNEEGLIMINGALNYFGDDAHILVLDSDKKKLNTALQNKSDAGLSGVVYTKQEEMRAKTNNKLVNCPTLGVAHRETVGNQRLIVEFFTYIFSQTQSSTSISFHWEVRGKMYNKRKKGWKWRRTWSDLRMDIPNRITLRMILLSVPNSGGAPSEMGGTPTSRFRNAGLVDVFTERAEVDFLLIGSTVGFFNPSGVTFHQGRTVTEGRVRGRRVSDMTNPNLDITVGCN